MNDIVPLKQEIYQDYSSEPERIIKPTSAQGERFDSGLI